MSLSKAVAHEETDWHLAHLRVFDERLASDVPGPSLINSPACQSQPAGARSPLPPSSPPLDWVPHRFEDVFDMLEDGPAEQEDEVQLGGTFTVHGPALDSDPPSQIYDNWGGNLTAEKPTCSNEAQLDELNSHSQYVFTCPLLFIMH